MFLSNSRRKVLCACGEWNGIDTIVGFGIWNKGVVMSDDDLLVLFMYVRVETTEREKEKLYAVMA